MAYQPGPRPPWPDDSDGTDEALVIGGPAEEVLGLCDEFFRGHAGPAVHAELRRFLTDETRRACFPAVPTPAMSAGIERWRSRSADRASTGRHSPSLISSIPTTPA